MERNRTQNAIYGMGAGFINNILTILLPFLTRTVILYTLGMQYIGLHSLFGSIISILNITELGIGGAVSYSMYRPLQSGDDAQVCALLAFYRKCYRIIGVITLVIGVAILPFLDHFVAGDYPADINLYILYIIYLSNNVLGYFLFAYKKVILNANQRYDVEVSIASVCTVLQNILQIGLLLLVHNYFVYVIVIPFITLIGNFVSSVVVDKMFPQFFCRGSLQKQHIYEIKKNVSGIIFTKISNTVFLSVDNIVISAFLGLTVLGVYGNYYYVISSLVAIFAVIHNAVRPVIGNCLITDAKEKLFEDFKLYHFMYMWFAGWAAICLICMYQTFEYVWGGPENILPLEIVFLLTVCFYIGRLGALQEVYLEAAGIYWERRYIPLIAAVLNLSLNIFMAQKVGLYGVILSTVISYVFILIPCNVYMLKKYCFHELMQLSRLYFRLALQLLVCLGCGWVTYSICDLFGETSVMHLIKRGAVCIIIPNMLYIVCFVRDSNLKKVLSFVYNIAKRNIS